MVLGLRTRNRNSPSVQVDYLIHIEEIKPWPPSQSLRTLRTVVIQWVHDDRSSGCTNQVVPTLGTASGVGGGRIQFNESFMLPVTLYRELSVKGGRGDSFRKSCIEFNLYEIRSYKTMKGELLGNAVVDLADYGVTEETLSISAPINCKRSYRSTAQPLLFLKIQPVNKSSTRSLSRDSLTRDMSMDRNCAESVSKLMYEEYAEEAEIASFTDDDDSSHSSLAVSSSAFVSTGGSPPHNKQVSKDTHALQPKAGPANLDEETVSELNLRKIGAHGNQASSSQAFPKETEKGKNTNKIKYRLDVYAQNITQKGLNEVRDIKELINLRTKENVYSDSLYKQTGSDSDLQEDEKSSLVGSVESRANMEADEIILPHGTRADHEAVRADVKLTDSIDNKNREKNQEKEQEHQWQFDEEKQSISISLDSTSKQVSLGSNASTSYRGNFEPRKFEPKAERSMPVKSIRSAMDSRSNGLGKNNHFVPGNGKNGVKGTSSNERKDSKVDSKERRNISAESKILKLEGRVKTLERELREAAGLEVGLYSIVAEHGSSINKVHAPARRLSRLYLHPCKDDSQSRRGSAAKSSVSGLVLAAKACGNDVPRLTFWLSNSIALRAIVSKSHEDQQLHLSSGPIRRRDRSPPRGSRDAWEDPCTFTKALEKVEAWIFSRIIESIWWQTLTPHMQTDAAKTIRKNMDSEINKVSRWRSSRCEQEQNNFSLELWKKAFKDACERICPVRAAGHECGCLPMLSRLIMEQCLARLDVAMFNAILRESVDEIPTDPVSDPISDAEVLPIPAGKSCFEAGAQLKTAIGNWSRWLTDLFGIDNDDALEEEYFSQDVSLKSFHLLNALSDLMMLPKDMLLSTTIRKEVCPSFGHQVIRRVLNAFVPDEFCPDPIPEVVLEALNSEDAFEAENDSFISFPCAAAPISYNPPSAAYVARFLGDTGDHIQRRSGSTVLKKSYSSDDELDELESPLRVIIDNLHYLPSSSKANWMPKESGSQNAERYKLLKEVWMKR